MIKMIIVEDMEILCDSLSGVLNSQPDIEVCATTSSADQALELCRKHKPDLALLDIYTEFPLK